MPSPGDRARTLLFVWLGLLFATFELFLVLDWGQGPARVGLLALLAVLLWTWRRWAPSFAMLDVTSPGMTKLARALLVVGVIANVAPWLYYVTFTARTGTLRSDQAQTVEAALEVLGERVNPYASDTVTDSFAYDLAIEDLDARPACRERPGATKFRIGKATPSVVPPIAETPECSTLKKLFSSLGFKYGPLTLLFYLPFVALLGPVAFLISHALLVIACALVLYRRANRTTASTFWATIVVLPFLWPTELAWNVLAVEHLDFLPVFLVTLAWLAWDREQYWLAALCVGASVAMKFLPGLLFFPLLIKGPKLSWGLPLLIVLACFAPFAAWDWAGLVHNVGYPFTRPPDSTSLAFFLSPPLRIALRALAMVSCAMLAVRTYRRSWDRTSSLEYLLLTQLLVIASGTAFHNNYLVWLLPLLSLYTLEHLRGASFVRLAA